MMGKIAYLAKNWKKYNKLISNTPMFTVSQLTTCLPYALCWRLGSALPSILWSCVGPWYVQQFPSTSINPEKCQKTTISVREGSQQYSRRIKYWSLYAGSGLEISQCSGTESMSDWRGILRTEDIKLMAFNQILPTAPGNASCGGAVRHRYQDYFTLKVCSVGKSNRRREVTQGNPLRPSEWGFKQGWRNGFGARGGTGLERAHHTIGWKGPFKRSEGPFKHSEGPFKCHRALLSVQRALLARIGPFQAPKGPFQALRGPFERSEGPFQFWKGYIAPWACLWGMAKERQSPWKGPVLWMVGSPPSPHHFSISGARG